MRKVILPIVLLLNISLFGQVLFDSDEVSVDYQSQDRFGISVKLDGNYALIGASGCETTGVVYVYQDTTEYEGKWKEVKRIKPDSLEEEINFGNAVYLDDGYAVVGAYGSFSGNYTGSVFIYSKDEGGKDNWGLVKQLIPTDGQAGDYFGYSVAKEGDIIVVGASQQDEKNIDAGAVYIYEKNYGGDNNWGLIKKLTADDGREYDYFGFSVEFKNSILAVGCRGTRAGFDGNSAVYIFEKDKGGENNWGEVTQLNTEDGSNLNYLGSALCMYNDYLLVGAVGYQNKGGAFLFQKDFGGKDNWGLVKNIIPSSLVHHDYFGYSVSIYEDYLIVGAPYSGEEEWEGTAYLFQRDEGGDNNWGELSKIKAENPDAYDRFGISVALDEQNIIIGNPDAGIDFNGMVSFKRIEEYSVVENEPLNTPPAGYELSQNYPNPFNPSTNISFSLNEAANTHLDVYNMLGEKVTTLVNSYLKKGKYQYSFDASNLASGVYFYTLTSGKFNETRQMLLIK